MNYNMLSRTIFFTCLPVFIMGIKAAAPNKATTTTITTTTNIGAIIDVNSRIGKEINVSMEIAAQKFNKDYSTTTNYHHLSLHFLDPHGNPLQAANSAEQLIKQKDVKAIINMGTWEETALVADAANRYRIPIISLTSSAITQPLAPLQWPFLIRMASNMTEQIKCIAAIVRSFNWRKVIPIYEVDRYGGDSGIFAVFTEAFRDIDVEIEHRATFPSFNSMSDPKQFVQKEVAELLSKQSRVFIVLQSSLPLAAHLFTEAKKMGLNGQDSVWILTECIASLLDSVNTSIISSMEGALGIKTHFLEHSSHFLEFKHQFRKKLRSEYPEEDNSEMGIYALRAHDSIVSLSKALERHNSTKNIPSTVLLEEFLSNKFTGLSGDIHFDNNELSQSSCVFRIVNVVGKRYKDIGFWSSKSGFSMSEENSRIKKSDNMEILAGLVNWAGDLKRVPKGWSMPTVAKPMKFGVPGTTSFEKFVKVGWNNAASSKVMNYSGFCIEVFHEVLSILKQRYPLPYEFVPYNGTYDDLVNHVANKTFDAVIGDVTILANRSKYVEFTQPFAESGLTMIVTVKAQTENAWIFLMPFTTGMWGVTGAIMIYTVLIVWLLERQSSPEFEGSWQNQLSTALWFTSSSLFFAHREQIHNNYARVVVSVWLFVVLALSSSYTASLSSMLTAPRLEPNVTDIGWLKKNNATVGCDGYSFVRNYLENVLGFQPANIKNINSEYDYPGEFESGNITAAFLEVPYEKAFLNHHCKGYTVAGTSDRYGGDRFGGLGFAFQKGSPIATDVSQAILTLLENGKLKKLEIKWFGPSSHCSTSKTPDSTDSLSWHSFWGLYLFSAATSTICYLVFLAQRVYEHYPQAYNYLTNLYQNYPQAYSSIRNKVDVLVHYFHSTSATTAPYTLDQPHNSLGMAIWSDPTGYQPARTRMGRVRVHTLKPGSGSGSGRVGSE